MLIIRLLIAASLLVQLIGERTSDAYRLEPISRVFAPTGSKATQSFEINNDGNERIALVVSVQTLERDDSYVETNRDAEDEFLIYPPQMVLSPGKRQTLRVTWLGDTNLAREKAYRIVVQQVPIEQLDPTAKNTTTPDGRVRVLLNYRGTLFIRPLRAAPKISIEAAPGSPVNGGRFPS
ncbi:MAG: molecular chaperone [Deltaproteobacteria bacterium]|nr:molecular chaperone [Deltaproteobacteria bacterium]